MEIDKLIECADIVRFIKAQRIQCLDHIQRMDQARPNINVLDWEPMGTRPVGRPRQRWQEDVILTYLLNYLLTYLLTYLLSHLHTYLLIYLHTYLLTYSMQQSPS